MNRTYGQNKRTGRKVKTPAAGEGKHIQAYLDPDTARRFAEYCHANNRRTSEVVGEIVKAYLA